ncbi:HigA family addiction module antitoxin [Niabella ginsengisoli]|uniref:HigA family addiction module antitoxin n=1 Tax=Niabella ginsengisoli TaxID=522298 RepID=A0ABS9SR80_9BACT|nr:HigA family addiction module antitoxin [Niabella ginsengisoli]MCH5600898.1 HigA family addiction module antitoxin [Niabella ginsengisoli]
MNAELKRGIAPEHPGIILREMYAEPLGITNSYLAENIGVTRITVNKLLNGRQGITAEMALRLSKAFKTSPLFWLNLQRNYDLWLAEKNFKEDIKAIA